MTLNISQSRITPLELYLLEVLLYVSHIVGTRFIFFVLVRKAWILGRTHKACITFESIYKPFYFSV